MIRLLQRGDCDEHHNYDSYDSGDSSHVFLVGVIAFGHRIGSLAAGIGGSRVQGGVLLTAVLAVMSAFKTKRCRGAEKFELLLNWHFYTSCLRSHFVIHKIPK